MNYHWNWGVFLQPAGGGATYLDWLLTGALWTILLSLAAWLLALTFGILVGVLRTWPSRPVRAAAGTWVEVFRDIPLLVQLFLWYFVVPELLPRPWGDAFKQWDPLLQQALAAIWCLGLFTSARVAEQVRAGLQLGLKGPLQAALALGMRRGQAYRLVLLPVALRLLIPPLTSEFLNVFKNSSVASTIGLLELCRQSQQLVDVTAQPYEAFIAVTLAYLAINTTIMAVMTWAERRWRVPATAAATQR